MKVKFIGIAQDVKLKKSVVKNLKNYLKKVKSKEIVPFKRSDIV